MLNFKFTCTTVIKIDSMTRSSVSVIMYKRSILSRQGNSANAVYKGMTTKIWRRRSKTNKDQLLHTQCAKDCGPHNRVCEYGRVRLCGSQFLAHAVEY